jgi:cardiolipin synthase
VWSEHFAGLLRESFEADLERSEEIEPGRWRERGPAERAAELAMRPLRREL